jgi:prolyl 4-hydroxylase
MPPAARARELLKQGDRLGAVAVVDGACHRGDPDALLLAASWRLIGKPLARDLGLARELLRRARLAGNADAALLEIALVANGSGAPPDWRGALGLLTDAARRDDLAAQHLALVSAMELLWDGAPSAIPAPMILSRTPSIALFPVALTPAECAHIATSVTDIIAPSMIADPVSGNLIKHPVRQSDDAAIGPTRESLVVAAINRRIAAFSNTNLSQGEPLNVLRYVPGQQYSLHSDALPATANQRKATAIIYLNDNFDGGQTEFPAAGLRVQPQAGSMLVFSNTLPDGRSDANARHAGLPVTRGVKWIATRWIRTNPFDPWEQPGKNGDDPLG